jgi:kinetochore protein NDC80
MPFHLPSSGAAANTLQAELASVQAAVQVQGLSVEEVTRLNTDHETLTHSYEETRQKVAQAREDLWSREMLVSRRSDQLETLVGEYNAAVYRLGLHPSPPAEVGDVSFLLLYEAAGATEREMLSGDVRGTLSPALSRLLSGRRLEITDIEGTIIKADHDLDELTQAVEALKEEIEIRTARVKSTSDQAESQRNVRSISFPVRSISQQLTGVLPNAAVQIATVESAELSAQQQHLEREIASSRAMSKQALLASESKMETLKMEYVGLALLCTERLTVS